MRNVTIDAVAQCHASFKDALSLLSCCQTYLIKRLLIGQTSLSINP